MNYEDLELQFENRLSFMRSAGVTVSVMPELESERSRPLPSKAGVTIIYAGSEYGLPNSTNQVRQEEKIFIQIYIESTFLRGPQGIYNLLSAVKDAIIGFAPPFCTRFQVVKHHTIGGDDAMKKDNMWCYSVIFQSTGIAVENFIEDTSVILKKITLIDVPGGEVAVIPNPNND